MSFVVNWLFGETVVYRSTWTVDSETAQNNPNGLCGWFFIEPSDTPFIAGTWWAEVFLDGVLLNTTGFTIEN
jgi:hypothetical protein